MEESPLIDQTVIEELISQLEEIEEATQQAEEVYKDELEKVHPKYESSAKNLLHYLTLRQYDLIDVQKKLGILGLSRMSSSESHVRASLKAALRILEKFALKKKLKIKDKSKKFIEAESAFEENTETLLGRERDGRTTRILVTLPTEAASDYELVLNLLENGANAFRINCAHDSPDTWAKMIENVRKAESETGLPCKINMDLGGPKLRTGLIIPGEEVIRIKPLKNSLGQVTEKGRCSLELNQFENSNSVPLSKEVFNSLNEGDLLRFRDAREKKRKMLIEKKVNEQFFGLTDNTIFLTSGLSITLHDSFGEIKEKGTIGKIPPTENAIRLKTGDTLILHKDSAPGETAKLDSLGNILSPAHISCAPEEVFRDALPGERILLDDGKIEGIVASVNPDEIVLNIMYAGIKGSNLRSHKGINLPDSNLKIKGFTAKDRMDMEFVISNANAVNLSFVNEEQDVIDLQEIINADTENELGIVLKIETQRGFQNLPAILLQAMQSYPVGVMIARGDLAVECGWENLADVQEEILKICRAARMPNIWATQVLETLAKSGRPSRAEITDASQAQHADCVMLNKGPYIIDAIKMLDTIIRKTEARRDDKKSVLKKSVVNYKLKI